MHNISKDREIPFSHFCYCSKIKFDNNCTNYLIYSLSRQELGGSTDKHISGIIPISKVLSEECATMDLIAGFFCSTTILLVDV